MFEVIKRVAPDQTPLFEPGSVFIQDGQHPQRTAVYGRIGNEVPVPDVTAMRGFLLRYATYTPRRALFNNRQTYKAIKMALPARFERATCGLGNRRSIHLSYGSTSTYRYVFNSVAIKGAKSKSYASWPPILERKDKSVKLS
jgi:hypothetical protein